METLINSSEIKQLLGSLAGKIAADSGTSSKHVNHCRMAPVLQRRLERRLFQNYTGRNDRRGYGRGPSVSTRKLAGELALRGCA